MYQCSLFAQENCGKAIEEMTKIDQTSIAQSKSISASCALLLLCSSGLGLAASLWMAYSIYAINLISHSSQILRLIFFVEAPIAILLYSLVRDSPEKCSYWKAVVRGILGLPVGALLIAFGAVVLGAPIGIQYFDKTLYWSLLMSTFTFVPAASVYGPSWKDWQRLFAYTKPVGTLDYMICIPAHGSVIGAWFGAWPMPLDWERPWQEWPICVSYGSLAGYMVGVVVTMAFVLVFRRSKLHIKGD